MTENPLVGRTGHQAWTTLRDQGVVLWYSGSVNDEVLLGMAKALKQKMAVQQANTAQSRRVFAIFVEQMQNMIRYSAEREPNMVAADGPDVRYGMIAIGRQDGGFVVETGNVVRQDEVERLRYRLEQIRSKDRGQLIALYKEKLRDGLGEPERAAGLGFLEIARRASKPIDFTFVRIDEDFWYFTLRAHI
jgi:hypothetical protein